MKIRVNPRYLLISVLTGIFAWLAAPLLRQELAAQTGAASALLSVVAYVCVVALLGALPVTLVWFLFKLWGGPYYRAWHINRIRNAREMRRVLIRDEPDE
jgi:hypothetical protein